MMRLLLVILIIALAILSSASALVVEHPGEFTLESATKLVITSAEEGGKPALKYRIEHVNASGEVFSTESHSSRVPVGERIVFFWDNTERILWWGSAKFLVSVPWSALRKQGDTGQSSHPTTYLPTVWDGSGGWKKWDLSRLRPGGVPPAFIAQAAEVLKE